MRTSSILMSCVTTAILFIYLFTLYSIILQSISCRHFRPTTHLSYTHMYMYMHYIYFCIAVTQGHPVTVYNVCTQYTCIQMVHVYACIHVHGFVMNLDVFGVGCAKEIFVVRFQPQCKVWAVHNVSPVASPGHSLSTLHTQKHKSLNKCLNYMYTYSHCACACTCLWHTCITTCLMMSPDASVLLECWYGASSLSWNATPVSLQDWYSLLDTIAACSI